MKLKTYYYATLIMILTGCAHKFEHADLIIHNAMIYTIDEENTVAQAVAVENGKIIDIGKEYEILNKYHYDKEYDAKGGVVFPGFIDAHCHFLGYGLNQFEVDLKGTRSMDDVMERVKAYAVNNTQPWIIGRGWDQEDWTNQDLPNNKTLNKLFPNTPVLLTRIDGHAALVNEKALSLTGITIKSVFEHGESIVKNGKLIGLLIDEPIELVHAVIPIPKKETVVNALLRAQTDCFENGLTTVDDAGLDKYQIEIIDSLQKSGALKIRIYAMISGNRDNLDYYLKHGSIVSDRLHACSFKFYADGALGSSGACLLQDYSDQSGHMGKLTYNRHELELNAFKIYAKGFQMNTHCIGDSANREVLKLYAKVLDGINDRRWRIEHAQVVNPDDYHLFLENTVIPSVQPTHATSDRKFAADRLGSQRVKYAYAYNDLLKINGMIALGTDFPVEKIDPLATFYSAVARKDKTGIQQTGWQMENSLSRMDAIRGMTIWAAIANFEEKDKGTIEKGKFADFTILNGDILKMPQDNLPEVHVIATFINGEQVFEY